MVGKYQNLQPEILNPEIRKIKEHKIQLDLFFIHNGILSPSFSGS
jgi:hypothetical protein